MPGIPTDHALLLRAVAGDAAALERLAEAHAPGLVAWVARRAPPDVDPEDVAQEAFVVLLRRRPALREPGSLGAYLRACAARILGAEIRKRRRRRLRLRDAATVRDRRASTPTAALARLDAAIRALPPELEEALDAYYARRRTYAEAARVLGVPRATVQSRLRRARAALRDALDDPTTRSREAHP